MARAHELVTGADPRNDAAEVRAHGVEAVVVDGLVLLDDEVRYVALEALSCAREWSPGRWVSSQPLAVTSLPRESCSKHV